MDQDYAFDKLSNKINTPKDILIKELKHKQTVETVGKILLTDNIKNKHIESFQEIFLSSLIKKQFQTVSDYKDLLDSNDDMHDIVQKLQTDQDEEIMGKYKNISFTEDQLVEAISRLYIYFFEIKINLLIKQLEETNDTNIFSEIENLKKKIENYQNTL